MKNIAIFASGTGTNAQKIVDYFADTAEITVRLIVSNRPDAPVLHMARDRQIDTLLVQRPEFNESTRLLDRLDAYGIDFIALAGFLWLVPAYLVQAYRGRIVNIHPALLPDYGGKGMYGMRVHRAVAEAGETQTGITIHYVNERYDEGAVIFQARCPVFPDDSPQTIAARVQALEHRYYAPVIEKLLREEAVVF